METVIIKGAITAMSNKVNEEYQQKVSTKTVYIAADVENSDKLIDLGMRMYTSESGDNFFIVKASKQIYSYIKGAKFPNKIKLTVDDESYVTAEGVTIGISIISDEYQGNRFFRLNAIKLNRSSDIVVQAPVNPFANEDDF